MSLQFHSEPHEIVQAYSRLWDESSKTSPDLRDFLSEHKELDKDTVFQVILADQFRRWRGKCEWTVQQYLDAIPQINDDEDLRFELILEELGHVEDRQGFVDRQDFAAKYSELLTSEQQSELDLQLKQCESLADSISRGKSKFNATPELDSIHAGSSQVTRTVAPFGSNDDSKSVLERIGRYDVQEVLGEGAFGVVYRAVDTQLHRDVAVKVPTTEHIARAGGRQSFLREARMVAQLDHAGIVPVYDVGVFENACYVVSKYIPGNDLSQRESKKLPIVEATGLVSQVARAMHQAHQHGLVHRDIKPANILIDQSGRPHVVDFGLALRDEEFGTGSDFVGTPAYMSPEQARGEGHRVDPRSDLYSLGVVLYELLTGVRPHRGATTHELMESIKRDEVRPPRQIEDSIPRELDRICLKALARRVSDRYSTTADFADELDAFRADFESGNLETIATNTPASNPSASQSYSSSQSVGPSDSAAGPVRVIPKGLRSFDASDSDFFHELIPGPRDRHGLPDSLRFWKHRIDQTDTDETFSVGMIYGPSGCGKSSLVKAGLLPVLDAHVDTVYVEASTENTESRILRRIHKLFPETKSDDTLSAALLRTRRNLDSSSRKLLIIVDQFEQALHAGDARQQNELATAFRQCDGGNVQAIVMVRDDFWMAATRFMRELEVPLVEGENSAAVDLFDPRHARRVLAAYGRAFGALPESGEVSKPQTLFIKQAIDGIADDGKVICIRLTILAEMVKDRVWLPETLQRLGGTAGIGATYLEEILGDNAPQRYREYSVLAREVLKSLLPEIGTDIRTAMRSRDELKSTIPSPTNETQFDDVLDVLDSQLRLITPARSDKSNDGDSAGVQSDEASDADSADSRRSNAYYQLSHDFLVPSLRQWLNRQQRSTARGRAELRLQELSVDWNDRPEQRRLPSVPEFVSFHALTSSSRWTDPQRKMMSRAARFYASRFVVVVIIGIVLALLAHEFLGKGAGKSFQQRLATAKLSEVPMIIEEMRPSKRWALPEIHAALLAQDLSGKNQHSRATTAYRLALLTDDPEQAPPLRDTMLRSTLPEFQTIRDALKSHPDLINESLWETLANPKGDKSESQIQAAAALATFDPQSERWDEFAVSVANQLVDVRPVFLNGWLEQLKPVGGRLLKPLSDVLEDQQRSESQRLAAAEALGVFSAANPSRLFAALLVSNDQQFAALAPQIEQHRDSAHEFFQRELQHDPSRWRWPKNQPSWVDLPGELVERIESKHGLVREQIIYAVDLPMDDQFADDLETLRSAGYRPQRIRPYYYKNELLVAGIWHRLGGEWKYADGLEVDQLHRLNTKLANDGFIPHELAGYLDGDATRYLAVWHRPSEPIDERRMLAIGVDDERLSEIANNRGGPTPLTRHSFVAANRKMVHSLILSDNPDSQPSWEMLQGDNDFYIATRYLGRRQNDVSMWQDPNNTTETPRPILTGLWQRGDDSIVTAHVALTSKTTHLNVAKEYLRNSDLIPVGIAALEQKPTSPSVVTSIWHRQRVTWRGSIDDVRRKSNAAMVILTLGDDRIFDKLKLGPDPTLRTFLIERLATDAISAQRLIDRLESEPDVSIRSALLLALAERTSLSRSQREHVLDYAKNAYQRDPDPAIHGACRRLMTLYGADSIRAELDETLHQSNPTSPSGGQKWFHGHNGHAFSVIDAGEFLMGFRPTDEYRNSAAKQHLRILNRRYAIATTETTNQQWLVFLRSHPELRENEGETVVERGGPQTYVPPYTAMRYCNWLSKQAGIPEDQWCYEPNEEGKFSHGMIIRGDLMNRTGYRLPTEGEWEFACRAGTETMFPFGEANDLLYRYAWYAGNSDYHGHQVAMLRPNDFGLFDILGNGLEYTQTQFLGNYEVRTGKPIPDQITDPVGRIVTNKNVQLSARGSGFVYENYAHTTPRRSQFFINARSKVGAFRIARTMPRKNEKD